MLLPEEALAALEGGCVRALAVGGDGCAVELPPLGGGLRRFHQGEEIVVVQCLHRQMLDRSMWSVLLIGCYCASLPQSSFFHFVDFGVQSWETGRVVPFRHVGDMYGLELK